MTGRRGEINRIALSLCAICGSQHDSVWCPCERRRYARCTTGKPAMNRSAQDNTPRQQNVRKQRQGAKVELPEFASEVANQVKLIYLDPPFNIGQAFEQYEDALEHSMWLTKMRDRLLQAKRLSSDAWLTERSAGPPNSSPRVSRRRRSRMSSLSVNRPGPPQGDLREDRGWDARRARRHALLRALHPASRRRLAGVGRRRRFVELVMTAKPE